MATEINDTDKVQLLFKQFTGVVNAKQQDPFPVESFAFKNYILNNNILSDNIPTTLPLGWRSSDLDGSSNIANGSVTNLASIGYPQLSFHKKRDLSGATFGSLKTWFITDGSGGSALKNAISFKNDPVSNSYNYSVYQKITASVFSPVNMYANPTFWLFDFKSGFLEFYGDEDDLNGTNIGSGGINLTQYPPVISFFQYVGATGGGGGGGGGDASYNNIVLQGNNLMQSVTIQPWPEPNPISPNMTHDINYVIATVDISGNSEMSLGYFTLQLGDPYKQVISFYAGVIENKGAFIKIISSTNEDTFNRYGFKNLKIISYDGTCYLLSTFGRAPGGAGDPDLLKIILVNNNANSDNPTNNPDWILRDNPAADWLSNGPIPPEIKMPWTVGSPPYPVPTLPPALVTVSLLQNDGQPYGVSTQPEYFQNNIVLDTSANILAGENGTGTIDICGGLYVDRDASFNMDVHVRSSVDISGGLTVDSSGTFGGDLIGLSGEIIGQGNSVFVNYKYFDDSDFTTEHCTSSALCVDNLSANWCIIAKLDSNGFVNNSCIFQIIDRSAGLDVNLTFILGVNDGSSPIFSLNVLENNYSNNYTGNGFFIRNLRVVSVTPGNFTTQKFYLQLDRVAYASSSPTRLEVRTYLNTQNVQSGTHPVYPWILGSYGNTLPSGTTTYPLEVNLQQQSGNGTRCNVVTNAYSVNLNGGHFGNNVDMSNNDITNINQLKGGSSNNDIRFQINSLEIEGDTILKLKNSNGTNTIDYSNNTLDFQTTNTIDNILNIRGRHDELLTIGNQDDNVLIDGSSVEIRSKSGAPPFGDIVLNNSGGGTGSIIMKNGNTPQGDIRFNASIGFDLSNNKLRVDKMEPSTTNAISFNDKDITDISNVKTRINFNAPTNMYTDTSANITTNLTTTGDIGFDTSNKLWSYAENSNKYIIANNNRVWFSTSNLPIASYNSGGAPAGISSFNSFYIIPSEIVNYSMYQDYRNGVGIQNDFTNFGTGYLKYIEVQNNGIIRGGGSKLNDIYITKSQTSPTTEPFYVKVNIKPSGGSWGTAQTLQSFDISVNSVGATALRGANFISNIPVATGDLIRIELVFILNGAAEFIFGQNSVGTAPYPTPSAAGTTTLVNGPRAMFWLDLLEYIPQLT